MYHSCEFPMLRKPVGGVAQARIADHLSAGASTSSRHLRHLGTESKQMSGKGTPFPDKNVFFRQLSGNKRFNQDEISHCEFEFPMSRKPVGGEAQARIAEHLSAGASTSSRHPRCFTQVSQVIKLAERQRKFEGVTLIRRL